MIAKTYSLEELRELASNYAHLPNGDVYEGLEIKLDDKKGIHYWMGFPNLWLSGKKGPQKEDFRYIAIIDDKVQTSCQRWGERLDPETGYEVSVEYTSVKTPVQGLIELQVNPSNRKEMWLKFVEVHSDYRKQGLLAPLLAELVEEMKRNGLTLVRSRVSEFAPTWLKPKMDKLLTEAGIPWTQPSGRI